MPRSSAALAPARARRRLRTRSAGVVLALAALAIVAPLFGAGSPPRPQSAVGAVGLGAHPAAGFFKPRMPVRDQVPVVPVPPPGWTDVAVLTRPVDLRATPGGPVLYRLQPYTEWGSPRVFAVVGHRGGWLAVLASELPNGVEGWIPVASSSLYVDPYSVDVSVADRTLTVLQAGRIERRISVAVGTPSTPTPIGRFGTTDKLLVSGASPYGCCILALTGHQPYLANGWSGGDRIAVHSTLAAGTIGYDASLGCLRADTADARWLVTHIPLGTVVTIH